jgi:hypothetical protein
VTETCTDIVVTPTIGLKHEHCLLPVDLTIYTGSHVPNDDRQILNTWVHFMITLTDWDGLIVRNTCHMLLVTVPLMCRSQAGYHDQQLQLQLKIPISMQ